MATHRRQQAEATTAGERIGRLAGMLSRTGGADVTLRLVFGAATMSTSSQGSPAPDN